MQGQRLMHEGGANTADDGSCLHCLAVVARHRVGRSMQAGRERVAVPQTSSLWRGAGQR